MERRASAYVRAANAAEGVRRDGGEGHLADGGARTVQRGGGARRPHAPAPRADGEEVVVVLPPRTFRGDGAVATPGHRGGGEGARPAEAPERDGAGGEGLAQEVSAASGGVEEDRVARGGGAA